MKKTRFHMCIHENNFSWEAIWRLIMEILWCFYADTSACCTAHRSLILGKLVPSLESVETVSTLPYTISGDFPKKRDFLLHVFFIASSLRKIFKSFILCMWVFYFIFEIIISSFPLPFLLFKFYVLLLAFLQIQFLFSLICFTHTHIHTLTRMHAQSV